MLFHAVHKRPVPSITQSFSATGPLIQVLVGVSRPKRQAMMQAGQAVPHPVLAVGLIDTGATCSTVNRGICTALGLAPTGIKSIHTPSTGGTACDALSYDVGFVFPGLIPGPHAYEFYALSVFESELAGGIDLLVGRDVLSHSVLVYNGHTGFYTIAF